MRITTKMLNERIDLVKRVAANANVSQLTYSGGLVSELWLRQEYGTCWLSTNDGKSTGAEDVGTARGNREVWQFLNGLLVAFEALERFN